MKFLIIYAARMVDAAQRSEAQVAHKAAAKEGGANG